MAWWKGLVPIGVAVAVALVVGVGVDFAHSYMDGRKHSPKTSTKPVAAAERERSMPRYVVGVRGSGEALVVRDVRTRRDVGLPVAAPVPVPGRAAPRSSPYPRFQRVAPVGANSYIAAIASSAHWVTFQRLTLDSHGRPQKLVPLPRARISGTSAAWSDLAVAPDGDTIAYVTYAKGGRPRLDVLSARTGKRKVWTSTRPGRVGNLSWAGSKLSFVWGNAVRTLPTTGFGRLEQSETALRLPPGSKAATTTPDGRSVVVALAGNSLQTYSLATRRPTGIAWKIPAEVTDLTYDHTGLHLLATSRNGTLYPRTAQTIPGTDLLDATW